MVPSTSTARLQSLAGSSIEYMHLRPRPGVDKVDQV